MTALGGSVDVDVVVIEGNLGGIVHVPVDVVTAQLVGGLPSSGLAGTVTVDVAPAAVLEVSPTPVIPAGTTVVPIRRTSYSMPALLGVDERGRPIWATT